MPTTFEVKKSYSAYPSNVTDGTVYVRQGSTDTGNSTVDGPEYSARLGSGTGLQLDKDKVYTVENQVFQDAITTGGTGYYTGNIPGLGGYFNGLKFLYNLNLFGNGQADSFYMNINNLGNNRIYDSDGNVIGVEWIKVGWVTMQYSTTIPNSTDPTSPFTGFQIVNYTKDPQVIGDQRYLKLTGGALTGDLVISGDLSMRGNSILDVSTPISDYEAVNKIYVDNIASSITTWINEHVSFQNPDVYADEIDGTKSTTYAYMYFDELKSSMVHDILGLTTAMRQNSTITVFVYAARYIKQSGITPAAYTYDVQQRYLRIPRRFYGGYTTQDLPTERDYTWINGEPSYIGPAGNAGYEYLGPEYRTFLIPEFGMIKLTITYNWWVSQGSAWSRTNIHCDAEEVMQMQ